MNGIRLLAQTGDHQTDALLQTGIDAFEKVFPGRVRGYYVVGSRADGSALPASDIDMRIIFKGGFAGAAEKERAAALCSATFPGHDVTARDEHTVAATGYLRLRLKAGSLLVYGEDIRPQLTLPSIDEHLWETMYRASAFCFSQRLRSGLPANTTPVAYPDPTDTFYGYLHRGRTEVLHSLVCAIATATVVWQARTYVLSKSDCLPLYRKHVHDAWTPLVHGAYRTCRGQWHYSLPRAAGDRRLLRHFCRQTVSFENRFLALYRRYLLDGLASPQTERRIQAARRLGEIIYPQAYAPLKSLGQTATAQGDSALRDVVEDSLQAIETALPPAAAHRSPNL